MDYFGLYHVNTNQMHYRTIIQTNCVVRYLEVHYTCSGSVRNMMEIGHGMDNVERTLNVSGSSRDWNLARVEPQGRTGFVSERFFCEDPFVIGRT